MKIEMKEIFKNYKKNMVLSDVNLMFEEGNIYGFIGRNGSGKTVLLKILCGYITPSSGDVYYDDKILGKDIHIPIDTRCLIEKPQFIPTLSGYQNLKLLANIQKKIGKFEIEETLKKVNLYEEKDKAYYKYSLGMKQKLGIAQVLMEDPKVIILDEPFNGIEVNTADKIRDILLEEKRKGKIIVIASHMKDDIEKLVDKLYKVEDGRVYKIEN